MKKNPILYLAVLIVLFSSCRKKVESCMEVDEIDVLVGDIVKFENCSEDFLRSEWDFGDGEYSDIAQTTHKFNYKGEYIVRLRVIDKKGNSSETEQLVKVGEPRLEKIIMEHYHIGNEMFNWYLSYTEDINNYYGSFTSFDVDSLQGKYIYNLQSAEKLIDDTKFLSVYEYKKNDAYSYKWDLNYNNNWTINLYDTITKDNLNYVVRDEGKNLRITLYFGLYY